MDARDKPLVFVTVGTDHHQFDRLVRWVDAWLESRGGIADVFIQSGTSMEPRVARWSPYLGRDEMSDLVSRATGVVCHGGPGTIQEARSQGFVPVVVPREADLGEHVDNHQVSYTKRIEAQGDVIVARTEEKFRALLDEMIRNGERFRSAAPVLSEQELAVARFERIIEVAARNGRSAINKAQPTRVLFIAGVGRSGTTLLDQMLGQVQGFFSVGELVHMWLRGMVENDLCACGEPFHECPFWSEVGRRSVGGWDSLDNEEILDLQGRVDRHRYFPLLLQPSLWPPYRKNHDRFTSILSDTYQSIHRLSGEKFIVDSSKYVSYAYLLRRVPNIDLRVVHLVRDSHGVVYSWTKKVRRPEVTNAEEYMPTYHPLRMALRWTGYNLAYEALPRFAVPTLRVRYESLVEQPREQVERILRFVGEDPSAYDLDFIDGKQVRLSKTHSCSGNPMRFGGSEITLRTDAEWKEKMPSKDRALVSALTGPLQRRYQYRG